MPHRRQFLRHFTGLFPIVLGVVMVGGVLVGAQPASAQTCIQDVWQAHGNTQNLTCTANDVTLSSVTNVCVHTVLNDPNSLSLAANKMYFQSFPQAVRAETLITKHAADVKEFAKKHGGECVLKPLQGSGGSGVFKVDAENMSNINQMIEAITRDGYIIAQAYVPAAAKGDIRLFIMNGQPLRIGKKYAVLGRVSAKDDIRSNIHAGGKAVAAEIGANELRVAERIRPKLIADGMFLVGIDIVGDLILEVNVFSPGNLHSCNKLNGVNFAEPIIASVERKVEISKEFASAFDNKALAVM